MRTLLKYTILVILLPIWVFPLGSMNMYRHICNSSQTVTYTTENESDCCGEGCGIANSEKQSSCCNHSTEIVPVPCCEYEPLELSKINMFNFGSREIKILPLSPIAPENSGVIESPLRDAPSHRILAQEKAPPLLYGRRLLIMTHQLKIALHA